MVGPREAVEPGAVLGDELLLGGGGHGYDGGCGSVGDLGSDLPARQDQLKEVVLVVDRTHSRQRQQELPTATHTHTDSKERDRDGYRCKVLCFLMNV